MDYEAELEVKSDSQILHVVDVETTGLDPKTDSIVEIGMAKVDIVHESIGSLKTSLIYPGKSIPHEASAVHHITDQHVIASPKIGDAFGLIFPEIGQKDLTFCAHHAEFDQSFLGIETDMVCTKRLSRHLWPNAAHHWLQFLRYFLEVELEEEVSPHRARGDVIVTSHILLKIVEKVKFEYPHLSGKSLLNGMLALSNSPVLLKMVGFGKYKGKEWSEVPTSYLGWVSEQDFDRDILHTVRHHLSDR